MPDDFKDIQILLVEDDEFNRMLMAHLFHVMDINLDEASDGEQAVEMARKKSYDLILMDISMPVMDGFDSTRKIRELPGYLHTPIIALTADISERVKQTGSGLFTDITTKPVDPDLLHQQVIEIARNKMINK
jgi:two-component system, sensor histidine kinase and response regulator